MEQVTRSIFGKGIDERCPGFGFWAKLFVFLGILADAKESEKYHRLDEELDSGY